jgi:hypothetical protein
MNVKEHLIRAEENLKAVRRSRRSLEIKEGKLRSLIQMFRIKVANKEAVQGDN